MKKTILSVIMAILILGLAQISYANLGSCFDVTIDVDDDTVKPGESFTVEVDVTNQISKDIDDVEVEIEIKDIDDGDNLDDDGDLDDLKDGEDDNIDFDFDVPYAVDEDDYEIIITITGDIDGTYDNGTGNYTKCETIINETIEVEKDKHELIMKQPSVDQETLKCSRTTEVSTTLWNIGTKDEDVELEVYNTELGISRKQTFELEKGDDEDDIKSTRRVSLDLSDATAKTYTFYVKAEYDDGDEYESESFSIKVEDCETAPKPVVDDNNDVVVVTPVEPIVTTPVVTVPAVIEESTFGEQYGVALLLGLAYIVVIVIGVLLVVSLLKKRG